MENITVAYECGVDINSSFKFRDGDLILSEYDENLVQAITNKLNTNIDELDLFYEEYGSILPTFLGWKATEETIHYMQTEISTVLSKEPRLSGFQVDVEYEGKGLVKINLVLYTTSNEIIETNLVLGADGIIEVETEEEFDSETEEE